MLLNDLLHCWACINVQAKDTVTKTSINNAI
jgi:hypothetical protein